MTDRFDIEQVIRILGLEIRSDQADDGRDFDVACRIALEKLVKCKEYEDLEEQGLLLRLPCKIRDPVWRIIISDNYIMPCNVEEFVYSNSLYIIVREELFNTRRGFNINEIGKTVFLTKAEAEQKLKEMEND